MRRPAATVASLVLALGAAAGCAGRAKTAHAPASPAESVGEAGGAHYAAASPAAAAGTPNERPSDRSSHGSPKFGDYVRTHQPQLQFCYAEARAKRPKLAGSATVAVTITDDGAVAGTTVVRRAWSDKSGGEQVERCVLAKVRAWQFPPIDPQDPHVHSFAVIFSN